MIGNTHGSFLRNTDESKRDPGLPELLDLETRLVAAKAQNMHNCTACLELLRMSKFDSHTLSDDARCGGR